MRRLAVSLPVVLLAAAPAVAIQPHGGVPTPKPRPAIYMPYVQAGTQTSMDVLWRSPEAVATKLAVMDEDDRPLFELNEGAGTAHEYRLANLKPGTTYHYAAYDNGALVCKSEFHTNPGPNVTRFKFAVMGDSGSGNANQYSVANRLAQWNPDFILHCGDVVYEKGEAEGYGPRFMEPYARLIDHTVFYPSPGNHDYGLGNLNAYTDFFEVPRPRPTDTEHYYTFTYGDAQFFSLDSIAGTGKDAPQTKWLAAQLAASKSPWKFAFFHHPFYSSGWEGPSPWLAKVWGPLFEKYNVQVVFSGHDHDYERIKLSEQFVRDGKPTQYIVTGGGGAWLRGVHPKPYSQITQAAYHFVGVTMTDRELTAEAIDDHGLVIDQFTVSR